MPLTDYQTRIADLLRDSEAEVTDRQRATALIDAVRAYSRYRPDVKVVDVAGAGSRLIALPAGWDADFSHIESMEYPIGQLPPAILTRHDIYAAPDVIQIILPVTVMETEQVRVTFTVPHRLDTDNDTIPAADMAAVCCYAVAGVLEQLAVRYAGDQDATIAADSVDHQGKADVYRRQAALMRKRFYTLLGVDPSRVLAAGQVVNLDMYSSRGHDRLTHSNRYR